MQYCSGQMQTTLNFYQAMALAVLQGVTEFLPVSSSGHLVLARRIFGWSDDGGLVFDTVLHVGSLMAILIYFWRDWMEILRAYFFSVPESKIENQTLKIESVSAYRRLPWLIVVATLPAVIAAPLKSVFESEAVIRNAWITGLSMIMTAFLFLFVERRPQPSAGKPLNFLNALFIGCMQVVAFLPGASRSGWTASAGIICCQKRENAVRFAFLMAVPAIAGAAILQTGDIIGMPQSGINYTIVFCGLLVSFVSSFLAIHFSLKYFRNHSLRLFAVYLMIVGVLALLMN